LLNFATTVFDILRSTVSKIFLLSSRELYLCDTITFYLSIKFPCAVSLSHYQSACLYISTEIFNVYYLNNR